MKKKIISIYVMGAILFGLSFSIFVYGHTLFTSDENTNSITMSPSAAYLDYIFDDSAKKLETMNLVYEHDIEHKNSSNDELTLKNKSAPYFTEEQVLHHLLYPRTIPSGEQFGSLAIDTLSFEAPIYYDLDFTSLNLGLLHDGNSALPGEPEHSVLYGEASSTLQELRKINKGSNIVIRTSAGTFTYQVLDTIVTRRNDILPLSATGEASLSLVGIYANHGLKLPQKYIIYSELVDYSLYY